MCVFLLKLDARARHREVSCPQGVHTKVAQGQIQGQWVTSQAKTILIQAKQKPKSRSNMSKAGGILWRYITLLNKLFRTGELVLLTGLHNAYLYGWSLDESTGGFDGVKPTPCPPTGLQPKLPSSVFCFVFSCQWGVWPGGEREI